MKRPISLVTGCSGFIGSHVAQELIAMGHTVVGLDDLSGGFVENNPAEIIFYQGFHYGHDSRQRIIRAI
jgi:UDP-glucose 4-epimerase